MLDLRYQESADHSDEFREPLHKINLLDKVSLGDSMTKRLSGKTAIVTGGSRGIGRAICLKLARAGANVLVNYLSSESKAKKVVQEILEMDSKAIAVNGDVSIWEDGLKLFETAKKEFGSADILVNNAGIMITKPLLKFTEDDFDQIFSTNVKGTFLACQHAMASMAEGGTVINLSTSVNGVMFPNYSLYAATKGAVEQLTRHLCKEFGSRKITINSVAPGPTETELFTEGKSADQIARLADMSALKRIGSAEDIADVVAFLSSDEARWITGQNIRANGGFI